MPSLEAFCAPDRPISVQLRRVPLFADLPNDQRGCLELLREGALFEVPAGIEIVAPGDPPALLVVTEGALSDGHDGVWSAGSYLGVAETLAGRRFASVIRTVAPTILYRLDGSRLDALMRRCPAIASKLTVDLAAAARAAEAGHETDLADRMAAR